MKAIFLLFFMIGVSIYTSAWAQVSEEEFLEDPLKKPTIWEKLKKTPNDADLWTQYTGKEWSKMSKVEQEKVSIWRQELILRSISAHEVVITSSDEVEKKMESHIQEVRSSDLKNAEEIIMQEQQEMSELKSNVTENFVILEDLYRDLYQEYGQTYKSYAETYPNKEYPIVRWIEEQDAKLVLLKKAKLETIKAQMGLGKK